MFNESFYHGSIPFDNVLIELYSWILTFTELRGVDKPKIHKDIKVRRQQEKNQTIIKVMKLHV